MLIFSSCPHELSGDFPVDENKPKGPKVRWMIMPGNNNIDDDVWAKIKDLTSIKVRVGRNHLRPGHKGDARDYMALMGPISRTNITDLCAKAVPMVDDQMYSKQKGFSHKDLFNQQTIARMNSLLQRGESMIAQLSGASQAG